MPDQTLLLVGAGHAHLEVIREFARRPLPGLDLVVLTREPQSPYSGMLPGVVAGQYRPEEAHVALAPLVRAAGGRLLIDAAIGLDPVQRRVLTMAHGVLAYDVMSLNIGSRPNTDGIDGAERAIPVKPIHRFLARFAALEARARSGGGGNVVLVGGGAAGVELALAVRRRLPTVALALITDSTCILPHYPSAFRRRLLATLHARGVGVHTGARVTAITPNAVMIGGGRMEADAVLLATAAAAPGWLRHTGLAVDESGFLRVDATLRADGDPAVFAAGDAIAFDPAIPHSGVFAVRAGPALAANVRAALTGGTLRRFSPPRHWLSIIGDGEGGAVATRNGLTASGAWVWAWKQRIDRRFMARYQTPCINTVDRFENDPV